VQIRVYGWIRSGTRWLLRLLSYYRDEARSLDARRFYEQQYWFSASSGHYHGKDVEIVNGGHTPVPPYGSERAYMVHIFRDPRDAFVSWYHFLLSVKNNMWNAEDRSWKAYLSWLVQQQHYDFRKYAEAWLERCEQRPPYMSWVRHEAMFANRSASLLRLLGEMGYRMDTNRAKFAARLSEQEPNRRSYQALQKETRRGLPGQWRYFYDAEDAQLIDHHYGDLIARLGYGREADWLKLSGRKEDDDN